MSYTPPSRLPSWATDGGAAVADPGVSKQATGWLAGEAPAADHTNWLLNQLGEQVDFLQKVTAPYAGHANTVRTATQPWTTDATWHRGTYLSALGRHYVAQSDAGVNLDGFDSADGITWSGAKSLGTGGAWSQWLDDGTDLFIARDTTLYKSTTGLVTDLASYATLPSILAGGMVYDKVNSYFIYASVGNIYYSATGATGTWTAFASPNNNCSSIAHNPTSGRTVVFEDTATDFWYSDNGTTWNQEDLGVDYDLVIYCAGVGAFCARRNSSGLLSISTGDDVGEWASIGSIVVDAMIATPEFLLVQDGTSTPEQWYAITNKADLTVSTACVIQLGHSEYNFEVDASMNVTSSVPGYFQSDGGGTFHYPYGGHYLAYSQYLAP